MRWSVGVVEPGRKFSLREHDQYLRAAREKREETVPLPLASLFDQPDSPTSLPFAALSLSLSPLFHPTGCVLRIYETYFT